MSDSCDRVLRLNRLRSSAGRRASVATAFEIRAKATFASLVQTRIAAPLGLDTLRVEMRTSPDSSGERATINQGLLR